VTQPTDDHEPAPAPRRRGARRAQGSRRPLPIDPDLSPVDADEPSLTHGPHGGSHPPRDARELVAIGAGGVLGTAARYGVERAWPTPHGAFPAATLAINTSGALALGVVLAVILRRDAPLRHLRAFACVGFLGAWTTMSTLATEADLLVKGGDVALAAGYVAASLVAGLVAVAAGIMIGRLGSGGP
jgi:fluoride exporter